MYRNIKIRVKNNHHLDSPCNALFLALNNFPYFFQRISMISMIHHEITIFAPLLKFLIFHVENKSFPLGTRFRIDLNDALTNEKLSKPCFSMLWLQWQAHVHGTLQFVGSGTLLTATRPWGGLRICGFLEAFSGLCGIAAKTSLRFSKPG